MINANMMYLRPGNLFKEFVIENNRQKVTSTGRVVNDHKGDGIKTLYGCLADATTETAKNKSTEDHTVTHTIVQRGTPLAKKTDKLVLGNRVFYVVAVDDTGGLGISTLYYVEEKEVKHINQKVRSKAARVNNALRNAELEVLKGQRGGKRYRKPHSKRTYQASSPGEPPARRTGALRLQWAKGVDGGSSGSGGAKYTAYIESQVPYAGYLENGTSKMAARPYVEKIKEKALPEIESIFSEDS